jgi:hypothetical protein
LITIAVSLFASAQLCSADFIGKLVGKWKSDSTGPTAQLSVVFKRLGTKGFVYKSTLSTTGSPNSTGTVNYNGNGSVSGTVNHGGIVATVSGTWRIRGQTFSETSVITSRFFTTNTTSKSTLLNSRKIKTISVVNGSRSVGTLSKIRRIQVFRPHPPSVCSYCFSDKKSLPFR